MKGEKVTLRAIEPEDLEFLYQIENDLDFWEVSNTTEPFSKYTIRKYIENSHQDVYEAKQLRLMIEEKNTNLSVGMIDLFDFNPLHKRAGIGIAIHKQFTKKGYAAEALSLLIDYSFSTLHLHQFYF